jgi:hypothetical protein
MQIKSKKNIRFILITAILTLVLILGIVLIVLTRQNKKEVKNYQKVVLKNYSSPYKLTQDFTFENELSIPIPKENFYYQSGNIKQLDKIRTGANKLGLSKENQNTLSEFYLWSKTENTQIDAITLNNARGLLNLNYQDGVNSEVVEGKDSYTYMSSFFGLSPLDTKLKYQSEDEENVFTYSFKQEFLGKEIYFDQGTNSMSTVRMKTGKVIEYYTYITDKNLTKGKELKPLSIVSNANIQSLNYFMNFEPANTVASSLYGSETQFIRPVSIFMKDYSESFYYRIEGNTFVLYPAIKISGEYIDNKNNKGNVTIVVINQDPSYQPKTN